MKPSVCSIISINPHVPSYLLIALFIWAEFQCALLQKRHLEGFGAFILQMSRAQARGLDAMRDCGEQSNSKDALKELSEFDVLEFARLRQSGHERAEGVATRLSRPDPTEPEWLHAHQ